MVVELRQYTLKPGRRDELIALFEKHFVHAQEAHGMRIHGWFRVDGLPDRFVWLRGFDDMAHRRGALEAFYGGAVWKAHREAANATMLDSDNVLLLRPGADGASFALRGRLESAMLATTFLLGSPVDEGFLHHFRERLAPVMARAGAPAVVRLQSLEMPNDWPKLPVREGEHAFVVLSELADDTAYEGGAAMFAQSRAWRDALAQVASMLAAGVEHMVLQPANGVLAHAH
jgi:hypothetical protein